MRTIKGLNYIQAECQTVDFENKTLKVEETFTKEIYQVPYDKLIIAPGMRSRTFGTPGVDKANHVYFLKNLWDARMIRTRLMECFERAANPFLPADERRRLLTFIVVGGGPTSVEFAGELNQFIKEDVKKWYPELYLQSRIKIVEVGKELLSSFSLDIQDYVRNKFLKDKMEIVTEVSVKNIARNDRNQTLVELSNGQVEPYGLMVWSTGVESIPFVKNLDLEQDVNGRIYIDDRLQVRDHPDVYAMGDCAIIEDKPYPPVAQVANQQATYLGKQFNKCHKKMAKLETCAPFKYTHRGQMASIGKNKSVVDTRNIGEQSLPGAK